MEVTNRFKGLDLIEYLKNYGWRFVILDRRQGSRPSPKERSAKRQNGYLRRITLQIAEKKRETKGKGDCSHEIKRCLLLGRKVMTNLDSILKSRDITLPTKVHLIKATVSPVVMNGCESWTIKKAEHRRINAIELWYLQRLLRVPWTARSNQSILKEISPECSSEELMLKLKLQYFGYLM